MLIKFENPVEKRCSPPPSAPTLFRRQRSRQLIKSMDFISSFIFSEFYVTSFSKKKTGLFRSSKTHKQVVRGETILRRSESEKMFCCGITIKTRESPSGKSLLDFFRRPTFNGGEQKPMGWRNNSISDIVRG